VTDSPKDLVKNPNKIYFLATGLIMICGLLFIIVIFGPGIFRILTKPVSSTPDFAATVRVLISSATPKAAIPPLDGTSSATSPTGQIVYTCQINKVQSSEQICIMNADGSDQRRLSMDGNNRHFYPSLSPDGRSVVYSGYDPQSERFEIYEYDLVNNLSKPLTFNFGDLNGPEISPDEKTIVFTRYTTDPNHPTLWLMDRAGGNYRQLTTISAWDPTWSPDGTTILFASDKDGLDQLYKVNIDGSGLKKVSNLPALRGRSDWSPQNLIATYSGEPWQREIYIMEADGSDQHQISPPGGNSQGPSFSPDGQWIAFTAYFDKYYDINGCEIYIMHTDGTNVRRLTNNDFCDYQPRWGP
jgi:Tol biopolymer transport system component